MTASACSRFCPFTAASVGVKAISLRDGGCTRCPFCSPPKKNTWRRFLAPRAEHSSALSTRLSLGAMWRSKSEFDEVGLTMFFFTVGSDTLLVLETDIFTATWIFLRGSTATGVTGLHRDDLAVSYDTLLFNTGVFKATYGTTELDHHDLAVDRSTESDSDCWSGLWGQPRVSSQCQSLSEIVSPFFFRIGWARQCAHENVRHEVWTWHSCRWFRHRACCRLPNQVSHVDSASATRVLRRQCRPVLFPSQASFPASHGTKLCHRALVRKLPRGSHLMSSQRGFLIRRWLAQPFGESSAWRISTSLLCGRQTKASDPDGPRGLAGGADYSLTPAQVSFKTSQRVSLP